MIEEPPPVAMVADAGPQPNDPNVETINIWVAEKGRVAVGVLSRLAKMLGLTRQGLNADTEILSAVVVQGEEDSKVMDTVKFMRNLDSRNVMKTG